MITLALAALLAVPAGAAAAPRAPEFKIAKVFNAPVTEIKSLASLKGKVVFLEFWATWCGPCVAGVPRTNRLIESLKGEPVVFLAVTDEPADKIAAFLKLHEFKAWVGVDEAMSSLKAYKVRSRPDGYLIGKDGALLARVYPDSLKESDLRNAVAGRFTPTAVKFGGEEKTANRSLFELKVSSASGEMGAERGSDMLEVRNLPFNIAIAWIWDTRDERVLIEHPPVESFNARLQTTQANFANDLKRLKIAVQAKFGVSVKPEIQDADVFLLSLSTAPGAPRPKTSDAAAKSGIMGSGPGRLLGNATMAVFAKNLAARKMVIDETGLTGEYALDLEWKPANGDLDRALATQGLRLVPGRRQAEFLRVVPAIKN